MNQQDEWQEAKGNSVETDVIADWSKAPEGHELIGYFIDKATGLGENGSTLFVIETAEGKKVGVWGSTVLDERMNQVPVNAKTKITYLGKKNSQKGGRSYHTFEVKFNPNDIKHGAPAPQVSAPLSDGVGAGNTTGAPVEVHGPSVAPQGQDDLPF